MSSLFDAIKRAIWQGKPIMRRPEEGLFGTKTRNGRGLVKKKPCRICGTMFIVHEGWPNDDCGQHLKIKPKPKEKKFRGRKRT